MRVITGVALGTYFAKGAEAALETPNASEMRGLVYAVKDNRQPPIRARPVRHIMRPADRPVMIRRSGSARSRSLRCNAPSWRRRPRAIARSAEEILAGFDRTTTAVPRRGVLVLVDDNVQRGASLAALDRLLGASGRVAAFAVAITDKRPRPDAYRPRQFEVRYEPSLRPLMVELDAR